MQKQDTDLDLEFGQAIEVVYDAVVDRSRFDELITLALKVSSDEGYRAEFQSLRDALDTHILTAEKLLQNIPQEQLKGITVPIVSVDATGSVLAANEIAQSLLGVVIGQQLTSLNASENMVAPKKGALPPVLRMRRQDSGKSYVMMAQSEGGTSDSVDYKGAEVPWNSDASTAIRIIFQLTKSEAQIMGLLVSAYSPVEIAEYRGRSIETVRQQIKTIYSKTACKGLSELLQLAQAVLLSAKSSPASRAVTMAPARRSHIILKDGRRMDYHLQGADQGSVILFLHGCLCGNLFPDEAADYLRSQNIRLISPARPAHGGSTKNLELLDDPSLYANDLIYLMNHLDVESAHIVGFDIGSIFGLCSVARLGSRLKSLTCVSAHPPIRGYRDIAAMPQQQRVFTILPKVSMPLLRFLAKTGDRKLKREGPSAFPRTVFADAEADLKACEDPELLKLFWAGHHFHVENGSDGFITDCQLAASAWIKNFKSSNVRPFFMHGNANATIQTKRVAEFASSIDAELKILGGAGHSLPFTHWRELFSTIEKY